MSKCPQTCIFAQNDECQFVCRNKIYQQGKTYEIIRILDYVRKNCNDKELEHFILSEQIEEQADETIKI